jgi:uncharacterized membrane protein
VRARASLVVPLALSAAAAVGYAGASVYRHDRFGSNAYDLGIFDQTVWGYSRFEMLPNTVVRLPNLLGDHFHPILIALGPLYWIWDDPRMLLVAQAALIALAAVPVFLWAREQLGLAAATLLQAAYLAFWAVLGGNLFDFHDLAVAAPIVSFALYALLTRRDALLLGTFALALLTREDIALTFAALGLYAALIQRRWRLGLGMAALSLVWLLAMLELVLPELAGRPYPHWSYPALGDGPGEALVQLVAHPIESARLFLTPETKQTALFNLLAPWLFLPLLSPLALIALPSLAARFFSNNPSYWASGFHYSLVIAPILAFAAIDAASLIRTWLGERAPVLLAAGALLVGLYFSFHRLAPLDELERYTTDARIADIRACLDAIPADASVAATSALVPHLSHRKRIYVLDLRPLPRTDVLALDTSTWRFPLSLTDVGRLVDGALARGYGVRCSEGGTLVLARGAPGRRLDPELRRILGPT